MLSIQIDTKSLKLVIYYQFNNIKLSLFASHMKSSFPLCRIIRYSRVRGLQEIRLLLLLLLSHLPQAPQLILQGINFQVDVYTDKN